MIYLYDSAVCDDLRASFNPDNMGSTSVKVVDPDAAVDVVSQIQNDEFQFPAVVVTRAESYSVDSSRLNFTWLHRGVSTVLDEETNTVYNETVLPINLTYSLTVLATNTQDADELTRELMFKYAKEYFSTIHLPYESKRPIRFGLTLDTDAPIEQTSRQLEYLNSGKVYQTIVHLKTEGCVLVTYTPNKMHRYATEPEIRLE